MSYDIYGNNLRRGHCEVHPHVHEEYPCSICYIENTLNEERKELERLERQHYEEQEQEYYERLHIKNDIGLCIV